MTSSSLESRFSSIVPRVEFVEVQDQYSYNEDLVCRYSLNDYDVQEGDRIAIFKLGWQYVKDYILFEWVPKESDDNIVVFNKMCLPRNTIEIYQFCFVSGENNVHGASEPFQFNDRSKTYQSLFAVSSYKQDFSIPENYKSITNFPSSISITTDSTDKDQEIAKLREENEFLRNTLKIIVTQNNHRNYNPDIEKLKKVTAYLHSILSLHQDQIRDLKKKVSESCLENNKLHKEKKELEYTCEGLCKKLEKQENFSTELNFDFGELESIPPFPFAK